MHSAVVAALVVALIAGFPSSSDDEGVCPDGFETIVTAGAVTQCAHPDNPPNSTYRARSFYSAAAEARSITCVGDGTDGNRLQALYVTEGPPSLNDADRSAIELGMINTTAVYETSSALLGESLVLPRWVHDGACRPDIAVVSVPPGSLDNFSDTIQAVAREGYNRSDRKYIMWTDSAVLCGVAAVTMDDSKNRNANDGTHAGYARIDRACWGYQGSIVAHEVTHTLGAVLPSAPNATPYGHCSDEYDIMCYDDGPVTSIDIVCGSASSDHLLDCNSDDYFHTQPPPGSYLATHWNVADSSFLERIEPEVERGGPMEFVDVPPNHPMRSEVGWLAERGVTRGCGSDRFCPDQGVTRGQMAAFFHRYAPDVAMRVDPVVFTDVTGSIFDEDIAWLAQTGITRGCGAGSYCPDDIVTRGQIAAFLYRLLGDGSAEAAQVFRDVPIESPFVIEIAWLAQHGVTDGCGQGDFCPDDAMTRAEMAVLLFRAAAIGEADG